MVAKRMDFHVHKLVELAKKHHVTIVCFQAQTFQMRIWKTVTQKTRHTILLLCFVLLHITVQMHISANAPSIH